MIFFAVIFKKNISLCNKKSVNVMNFVETANSIFKQTIIDYHKTDNVDAPIHNPYKEGTIEYALYLKSYIDVIQWHLEDIIRDPAIDPVEALKIKRRIDASNQDRTDMVERIDSYFWEQYHAVSPKPNAKINTESPAWAIDRLSILHLKIYHMNIEATRDNISEDQRTKCKEKLQVLLAQLEDMTISISQLLEDYASGERIMKMYKQMKMYNDPSLNPVLYKK